MNETNIPGKRSRHLSWRRGAAALVAFAAMACGEFASNTSEPIPLTSIPVRLLNPSNVALRVALVWEYPYTFRDADGRLQVGHVRQVGVDQAVPRAGQAGTSYALTTLELHDVPPLFEPLALGFSNADFRMAYGYVVAYEDVNGNGQLDLLQEDASEYVDRIVARAAEQRVVYAEGADFERERAYEYRLHSALRPGFGIYTPTGRNESLEPQRTFLWNTLLGGPGMDSYLPLSVFRDARYYYELEPLDETAFLTHEQQRNVATLACATDPLSLEYIGTRHTPEPHETEPLPIEEIRCSRDNRQYRYKGCEIEVPEGPCRGRELRCYIGSYLGPDVPPAGWPCPCEGCPSFDL
jgi:hypothetical protein